MRLSILTRAGRRAQERSGAEPRGAVTECVGESAPVMPAIAAWDELCDWKIGWSPLRFQGE